MMILELKVESGSTFRLDKERMTWERSYNGRISHGKLYCWPNELTVGKNAQLFYKDDLSSCGKAVLTTKVLSITPLIPVSPDEVIE
jgi:hypothetical protein